MRRFWSYHGWEAILCLAASVTLVLNFSQGFYIPDAVADSVPLALLVCGVTLLLAYLGSSGRGAMVCFAVGFVGLAAGFFLWLRRAGIDIVDQEGSGTAVYIYCIAAPLIALLVFLLSRSRLGTAALFWMGGCLHGLIAFLGYAVKPWCAALFAAAVVALFLMRQYRRTALGSSTVRPDFARYFALVAGVGLSGMLLALACWGLLIRPLQPPTLDLALLTKYMSYDVLEMVGIAQQYPIPDQLLNQAGDDQTLPAGQEEQQEEGPPEPVDAPLDRSVEDSTSPVSGTEQLDAVTYDRSAASWLVPLLVLAALLLASVPFLRRRLRQRRLRRLTSGDPREQVIGLYRFYLSRFARLGCPRAPAQTELEYAARYGEQLAPYLEGGPSLDEMTACYMDARYGGLPVPEERCQALAQFYPAFLRNYRALAGNVRYLTKYFVL